ncbi:MAG: EF-hand domain-containing protein [Gammaproteobacteria bacterium]|nr:EF-hand domain-containing protein [Gammaproteobacteria bacterium]MBU1724877.1 EF-hand domain-containing protein [Gammaproteobacteria bacterium]MBU2004919.1 EF-hand domain-containing protein [Gammaproteobacteria bacterium]
MQNKTLKLALGTTFAAGIALGAAQAIADNPFASDALSSGYMQLAENDKAGEMKCGANMDGKCGAGMKRSAEGTCGGDMKCPADTNEDGMVTKEEFMTHHEKMFDEADTDKDGSLNADERKVMHKNMEGKCGAAKTDDAKPADGATAAPAEEKK